MMASGGGDETSFNNIDSSNVSLHNKLMKLFNVRIVSGLSVCGHLFITLTSLCGEVLNRQLQPESPETPFKI